MARDPSKTEKPTPKKLREARREGRVPRSVEVSSAAILLTGLLFFYFAGQWFLGRCRWLFQEVFHHHMLLVVDQDSFFTLALFAMKQFILILGPLLALLVVVAVAANLMQVGFLFTFKPIAPKFDKVNPVSGFGRIFSLRSLVDLAKSLFKIIVLAWVAFGVYRQHFVEFFGLLNQPIHDILGFLALIAFKIIWRCAVVLAVLAVLDYLFQRWDWMQNLKMTKDEVKDEFKQMEGDPQLRARIRSLQMAAARQRMMQEVPRADVVITNPVHLAVALRYDQERQSAPMVIAKGAGVVAENIKKTARQHGVPVVENKPLARLLFRTVKLNEPIPTDLYQAVAEVLAYVYRLKHRQRRGRTVNG
ncbi:MAG: flagellar biosynthesis protein FlhB [Deltaproteobacteria bacterium]|nr:flagellar biosynthesis protein FlhB [Candidatus Anaeroferrophillacea bacterium]